jgi:hypothetical protein
MSQIKRTFDSSNDGVRDIDEIHAIAAAAEPELRTLRDMEMGWVAGGGDGGPVWGQG